ncbi:hypothetical protein GUJ93_ZPchr0011g27189 [Zizania palustris]|uniref:Uncharacterized protein n=1 Tax=Zizania palustris TaxID=103762 RepID=A0A8J6BRT4_ZIZPA|nr:hypothetical protein GUJ93_ZPchr0011g27189 [Zizania palustris]
MGSRAHGSHGQSSSGQRFDTPVGDGGLRLGVVLASVAWLHPLWLRRSAPPASRLQTPVRHPSPQYRLPSPVRRSTAAHHVLAGNPGCRLPRPLELGDSKPEALKPRTATRQTPVLAACRLAVALPRTPVSACCCCGFEKSLTQLAS